MRLVFLWLLFLNTPAFATCPDNKVIINTSKGQIRFQVEISDNILTRARGLMHRDNLGKSEGMLFQYDEEKTVTFWMKNVPIPLDILFISARGEIVKMHVNAMPFDVTPIPSRSAVQSVLEIRGGTSKRAQIRVGDVVRLECETE